MVKVQEGHPQTIDEVCQPVTEDFEQLTVFPQLIHVVPLWNPF